MRLGSIIIGACLLASCAPAQPFMYRDAKTGQIIDCEQRAVGETNMFIRIDKIVTCAHAMRAAGATRLTY